MLKICTYSCLVSSNISSPTSERIKYLHRNAKDLSYSKTSHPYRTDSHSLIQQFDPHINHIYLIWMQLHCYFICKALLGQKKKTYVALSTYVFLNFFCDKDNFRMVKPSELNRIEWFGSQVTIIRFKMFGAICFTIFIKIATT